MKGIALGLVFIAFSFAITWLLGSVLRDFADCEPDCGDQNAPETEVSA
jgi:hypothetical protein